MRGDARLKLYESPFSEADFKTVNDQIDKLWAQHPEGETVLNLARRLPEDARKTFVLDRGSWQKPARQVSPGVPAFLHPMPEGATKDRLGLAKWLVDRNSPTTAPPKRLSFWLCSWRWSASPWRSI